MSYSLIVTWSPRTWILMALAGWMVGVVAGCTTIEPRNGSIAVDEDNSPFSHELLDRVLGSAVDDRGRVDYRALAKRPQELDSYYRLLTRVSPDSHPQLFPRQNDRLAYWINAYNAAVLRTVLEYYPITTVGDVRAPWPLFFMPERSGFFYFQRPLFGGEKISLYDLENDIVRARFDDARIHFALNCASASCPQLPRRAFRGDELDDSLDRETRTFVGAGRNVHIDDENRELQLSSIFQWYEEDFEAAVEHPMAVEHGAVLEFIASYLPKADAARLRQAAGTYAVVFLPYDWALNDQQLSPR